MITRLLIFTALWASCKSPGNSDQLSAYSSESLQRVKRTITYFTEHYYREIERNLEDLRYEQKVRIWLPHAEICLKKSREMVSYLESLLPALEKADDIREKSATLFKRLEDFEKSIASITTEATLQLEDRIRVPAISVYQNSSDFYKDFFKGRSYDSQKLAITQLENDIHYINLAFIRFCASKCGFPVNENYYSSITAIVSQNSTILLPEEELEIKAGLGAFSFTSNPDIRINGQKIQLTDEGYASHVFPVQSRPGKYSVPVEIVYFNQITGNEETYKTEIKYQVFQK